MLASPEWVAKAREEVAPSLLESTRLRELFEALIQSDAASDQMPERLSPEAAAAWSYLKEAVQQSDQGAAALYDRAAQILRARPQYRVMDALTDPGEKRQTARRISEWSILRRMSGTCIRRRLSRRPGRPSDFEEHDA